MTATDLCWLSRSRRGGHDRQNDPLGDPPVGQAPRVGDRRRRLDRRHQRNRPRRHSLLTKYERLLRLEEHSRKRAIKLTDKQIRLLERFNPEFRERHIEAPHTGSLLAVDTVHVGHLKGVGRIYAQTAIDCHSCHAFAPLYTTKMPLTAVLFTPVRDEVALISRTIPPFRDAQADRWPDVLCR